MGLSLGLGLGLTRVKGASGDGRIAYGDQQAYSANGYTAYAAPWSTYGGGANAGLSRPADYQDTIRVNPATFPNGTRIETRWPSPGPGVITGYYFVCGPDYDDGDPASWPDWQVGNLTAFTETFSISMASVSAAADYIILNEFYLTDGAGSTLTKRFEIARWLHAAGAALTFFLTGALIGEYTDAQSRVWEVRNCGLNPAGAYYIVFLLKSRADLLAGTVDNRAALFWLRDTGGLVINHLYPNSPAIGLETYRGVNIAELASYSYTFTGSGSVIVPATEYVVNGLVAPGASPFGWQGGNYSGMSTNTGVLKWTAGPSFDGPFQNGITGFAAIVGKYVEVTYTILNRSAGGIRLDLFGGTSRAGTIRSANGTFTERLLVNSGNNAFVINSTAANTVAEVDNVSIKGPYNTATVGGV